MGSELSRLSRPIAPWLLLQVASRDDAYALSWKAQDAGAIARVVRGKKTETLGDFFDEFAAAFQFPAYFGENWPALHECLIDLGWVRGPAYAVIVSDSEHLLAREDPNSLASFLKLAAMAGESWSTPTHAGDPLPHGQVPFHVVLQCDEAGLLVLRRRLTDLQLDLPESV
jgi:RNAse (barnase) inhibitor barstar